VVRYAASAVAPVIGDVGVPLVAPLVSEANGSRLPSPTAGAGAAAVGVDVFRLDRLVLLLAGDARRESVLRKADLRLGVGAGTEAASIGSRGSFRVGFVSRSLLWSSTTSSAVRVSVRLCVGAEVNRQCE
jgi:hypothetical protein